MKPKTNPNRNLAIIATTFLMLTAATPVQAGPGDIDFYTPSGLLVGGSAHVDSETGASSAGFGDASCVINLLHFQADIGPPAWSCAAAAGIGGEGCFTFLSYEYCISAAGATAISFGVGVAGADGACTALAKSGASKAGADGEADANGGLLPMSAPGCLSKAGAAASGECAYFSAESTGMSAGGDSAADGEGYTAACGAKDAEEVINEGCKHKACDIDCAACLTSTSSSSGDSSDADPIEDHIHIGGAFYKTSNSENAPVGSQCYDSWQPGAQPHRLVDVLDTEQQIELLSALKESMRLNLQASKPMIMAPANTDMTEEIVEAAQAEIDAMWVDMEAGIDSLVDGFVLEDIVVYKISCA